MKELNELKEKLSVISDSLDRLEKNLKVKEKEKVIKELEQKTAAGNFWDNPQEAQKIMQEISNLKNAVNSLQGFKKGLEDLFVLMELICEEGELEFGELERDIEKLETKLKSFLLQCKLSEKYDENNAIVTLHSGAGGTEACDWVEMILRMYNRWIERQGYLIKIIDILPGEEAGVKRVTFIVRGRYAYGYLKAEIGVHRLVRISPFDSNKRRHTSFASCDVMPEIDDEIKIDIDEKDLRIDTYRASGHGGQHVNKTDSAVRITHLPTNIVVQCQNERSQFKNKATAMKVLKARLFKLEEEKRKKAIEKNYDQKSDIAWGNQIRSYVFCPYTMVKDHRTGTETGNVEAVMDGEIDRFIQAYLEKNIKNTTSEK